ARTLSRTRREHRHQRHRRSLRPYRDPHGTVRDRRRGRRGALDLRADDLCDHWRRHCVALTRSALDGRHRLARDEESELEFTNSQLTNSQFLLMRSLDEQIKEFESLSERAAALGRGLDEARLSAELARLEAGISAPDFWKDQAAAQKTLQRRRRLEDDLVLAGALRKR